MNSNAETADAPESNQAAEPATPPPAEDSVIEPVRALLMEYLERAGDFKAIVIGVVNKTGRPTLRMTPISPTDANDICRMLDVRVSREYAMQMFNPQGSPRAPVSQGGAQPAARLSPKQVQVLLDAQARKKGSAKKRR